MAPMPQLLLQLRGHSPITTGITGIFTHHILSNCSLRPWYFSSYSYIFFLMLLPYWTATCMPLFFFVNHQNVQLVHHHFFVSLYLGVHHDFILYSFSTTLWSCVPYWPRTFQSKSATGVFSWFKKAFGVEFCVEDEGEVSFDWLIHKDHFRAVWQTSELAKFSWKPSQGNWNSDLLH